MIKQIKRAFEENLDYFAMREFEKEDELKEKQEKWEEERWKWEHGIDDWEDWNEYRLRQLVADIFFVHINDVTLVYCENENHEVFVKDKMVGNVFDF